MQFEKDINNPIGSYNYSTNFMNSSSRSPLLNSCSQHLSNSYNVSSKQHDMINSILESCVLKWFPFLNETDNDEVNDKNGNVKFEQNESDEMIGHINGNSNENINCKLKNEILHLKQFYKGVKSSNFPLKQLCKTQRTIFNINDETCDEDVFYNSNSIYRDMINENEIKSVSDSDDNRNNNKNELFWNKLINDKNSNNEKKQVDYYYSNEQEKNNWNDTTTYYDCISKEELENNFIINNINSDMRTKLNSDMSIKLSSDMSTKLNSDISSKIDSHHLYTNKHKQKSIKSEIFQETNIEMNKEKKITNLKTSSNVSTMNNIIIKSAQNENTEDKQYYDQTMKKKIKNDLRVIDQYNDSNINKNNDNNTSTDIKLFDSNKNDYYAKNYVKTDNDMFINGINDDEYTLNKYNVAEKIENIKKGRKNDTILYDTNDSNKNNANAKVKNEKQLKINIGEIGQSIINKQVNNNKSSQNVDSSNNDYIDISINNIIQNIKNEEIKEKNITMDSYGLIYLNICLKVINKNLDYFEKRKELKNELLINEKKKIKEILKLYDKLFYNHFKFIPNKIYKETLRPIYSYYQNLKHTIMDPSLSSTTRDKTVAKKCSQTVDNNFQIASKSIENVNELQKKESVDSFGQYNNLSSFSGVIKDMSIKKILMQVDDSSDIRHLEKDYKYIYKDLVKLKGLLLKKKHYKNILFEYQKLFLQTNNRYVRTYKDIYPVEKEYKVYTQIKKETVELISTINAKYNKYYLSL
ncbi:conserved protein, unknown function [Hepatocystis sp. ex Piliocolobus tephrosceles]|nr:conserved protein, unknown function [Hepatocystis sp. ex Piliocolobus tephrosceles]